MQCYNDSITIQEVETMKDAKNWILIALMLAVAAAAVFFIVSGSDKKNETSDEAEDLTFDQEIDQEIESLKIEEEGNDYENPAYDNEQEDAVVNETTADENAFYGKWVANSNRAHYLYGNINLDIKEDGSWTGNITEEDYSGTWSYNGEYITLESELVNCDLFFAEDGQLMFRDHTFPEDLVVLSKD